MTTDPIEARPRHETGGLSRRRLEDRYDRAREEAEGQREGYHIHEGSSRGESARSSPQAVLPDSRCTWRLQRWDCCCRISHSRAQRANFASSTLVENGKRAHTHTHVSRVWRASFEERSFGVRFNCYRNRHTPVTYKKKKKKKEKARCRGTRERGEETDAREPGPLTGHWLRAA